MVLRSSFQEIFTVCGFLYIIFICGQCDKIEAIKIKDLKLNIGSSLCQVDEKITKFLTKFIRAEFSEININIIYDSKDNQCENIRQIFHHNISQITTTTVSFYNPRTKYDHELIGFHPHQLENWPELNVVILFNGNFANETVDKLVKLYHFKRQNSFTIFWQRENRMENFLEISSLQRLKYKIELYTTNSEEGQELEIKSRCFYCDDGNPETQTVATINLQKMANKIEPYDEDEKIWRRTKFPTKLDLFKDYTKNFNGKILRVSLSKGIPTMMSFKVLKNGRIETSGGFQTQLFHLIRKKLNFSYNITVESTFGLEGPNGTFNGMVGAVQQRRADLGLGASFTHGRNKVVHYLTPNTFHLVTFITGHPQPRPEWQNIFLAFTFPTWITLFCMAGFLVYPTFIVANLFNPSKVKTKLPINKILISGIGFSIRPIFEQRWNREKSLGYNSVKILALFWLIGILIVRIEFKSNLMKLTVSPPMESIPETFTQLANSDYNIYTHYSGGSLDRIVRSTHSPTFDKITMKMKKEISIKKCLGETLKGKTACISYEDDAIVEGHRYYSDPYGHIFIHRAPVSAFNFFAGVILPKEAVYIDTMESTVSQIVDMGIAKRFHDEQYQDIKLKGRRWAKQRKDKTFVFYETGHHYDKLVLSHFLVPFFLLMFGYLFASIVWVIEQREQLFKFKISAKTSIKSNVIMMQKRVRKIKVAPRRHRKDDEDRLKYATSYLK